MKASLRSEAFAYAVNGTLLIGDYVVVLQLFNNLICSSTKLWQVEVINPIDSLHEAKNDDFFRHLRVELDEHLDGLHISLRSHAEDLNSPVKNVSLRCF